MLHDDTFIKLKPTIIYLSVRRHVASAGWRSASRSSASLFDQMFHLTEEGWRKLTWRWALFFFALAMLNEIVWRTQTTDFWVSFKLFGVVPLTFVFGALQMPLINKYSVEKKP